jgi:hypothetical protein
VGSLESYLHSATNILRLYDSGGNLKSDGEIQLREINNYNLIN